MLRRCSKQLIWNILNENVHRNRSKDFCSAVNINLLLEFKASDEKEVVKLLTLTGIYRAILFCLLKLEACSLLSHKIRIIYERNRSLFMRVARPRVCVCIVNIQVDVKTCIIIFHVEEYCYLSG